MKPFLSRILISLLPCLVAAVVVGIAYSRYQEGEGGFKLGVDLAGGTILVYEVDVDKFTDDRARNDFKIEELVAALKRRIDPNDLKNVTIRPAGKYRVEIILPTGGHSSRNFTRDEVEQIKQLVAQVGSLEFRIVANEQDDREAIDAAREFFRRAQNPDSPEAKELQRRAERGLPPPSPGEFEWKTSGDTSGRARYSWVELGKTERQILGLSNATANNSPLGQEAARARERNEPFTSQSTNLGSALLYSRSYKAVAVDPLVREKNRGKQFEYFVLVRDTDERKAVTGKYLINAFPEEHKGRTAVGFQFNTTGGNLFRELTSANKPSGGHVRHLAIILDGLIESAPALKAVISDKGVIEGNFDKKQVEQYIRIFKAGALPATLKSQPVSEDTMGATLGADTIRAGTLSVILAFLAVLVFMVVYYRFAGLVACVALFANLLLTIGFMVLVNATFTLPGLAGLVLMLAMAVDANVLIYERIREERDRGASLALAIRNGYDRAFPTIIDTHLSSIFTAIVLYAVGNDQLRGFGVSLTAGLVISLFTSLYMTRLMFDIWLAKGWLHKLSMFRLLSNPGIDFMRVRNYWFAATGALTVLGITIFLVRGPAGLNIDFVGGTAYGGRLEKPEDIEYLRNKLSEESQKKDLVVASVKELSDDGLTYEVAYQGDQPQKIRLRNKAIGGTHEEREEYVRKHAGVLPDLSVEQVFVQGAEGEGSKSPFFTVRTTEKEPELVQFSIARLLRENGKSLLKQVHLDEALAQTKDGKWVNLLKADANTEWKDPKTAVLVFDDYTPTGFIGTLLIQSFHDQNVARDDPQPFDLTGIANNPDDPDLKQLVDERYGGKAEQGNRYKLMKLTLGERALKAVTAAPTETAPNPPRLANILRQAQQAFNAQPQPERLGNFDSQFAADTQARALYAIVASWLAILAYLWFRFGNWTFGLAAVVCLIHDLLFTLGLIAFCHYIHLWMPGFATLLGLQDFKIDLSAVAALLTLVGYSVNDTIVVFDRIREVRGKNPELTPQMINDSVNQTLSRTLLTSFITWLVVVVLYIWGGEGVHLFAFVMVVGVVVGTYSSIYVASPLLLIFGEGAKPATAGGRKPQPTPEGVSS